MAKKDVIRTDKAPGPFQGAPYNQAVRVGGLVFVAGQLGSASRPASSPAQVSPSNGSRSWQTSAPSWTQREAVSAIS